MPSNPRQDHSSTDPKEYDYDPRHDPLHKDETQAEASEYGIYGYQGEAGDAFEGEPGPEATVDGDPDPRARPENQDPSIGRAQGGKDWHDTEHGKGFGQPMAGPQRTAHNSDLPLPDDEPRG